MGFDILAIRDAQEIDGDATFYPLPSDADSRYLFGLEPGDGNVVEVAVTSLSVKERPTGSTDALESVVKLPDISAVMYVTESRVVVACEKYTKGGGWIGMGAGALLVASTANIVSHIRAARRRRGKILVGQVRYPWLLQVGASTKTGLLSSNSLRLMVRESTTIGQRDLFLDIGLDRRAVPAELARFIAHSCAYFRLAHDVDSTHEKCSEFESVRSAPALKQEPNRYPLHVMPKGWIVSAESAYPAAAATAPSGGKPVYAVPSPTWRPITHADADNARSSHLPLKLGATMYDAEPGVFVEKVTSGGRGEAAGLMPGDVIHALAGTTVWNLDDLLAVLHDLGAHWVELGVSDSRGRRTVVLVKPRQTSGQAAAEPFKLGATLYDAEPGAYVEAVIDGGPADAAGLCAGDTLTSIAGRQVVTASEFVTQLREHDGPDTVSLEIRRGQQTIALNMSCAR